MFRLIFIGLVMLAGTIALAGSKACVIGSGEQRVLNAQAAKQSLEPVRPGAPGERPFWNGYSRRFVYAPSFNFEPRDGAAGYRFRAMSAADGKCYVFTAKEPWASFTPIWDKLPVGQVNLLVMAIDENGKTAGFVAGRDFYKAACYKGPYPQPPRGYLESARLAWEYMYHQKHIQRWADEGTPDPDYTLYCYASKIVGAVVRGMVAYSKLVEGEDQARALKIATNAADYLLDLRKDVGASLAGFPPTYVGRSHKAGAYGGTIMMKYPAEAGIAFLTLYQATGKKVYLEASQQIAGTYIKLQLPNGTWPLKVDQKTGKPTTTNVCIPTQIIAFLDMLEQIDGQDVYKPCRDAAFSYILKTRMNDYNWEGQFEDKPATAPYENLSGVDAGLVAEYLLDHYRDNPDWLAMAETLVRYYEDQFVVWSDPMPTRANPDQQFAFTSSWLTPCVLEQYHYYVPVSGSNALMTRVYLKAYRATGNKLYLAKSVALCNSIVASQNEQERFYPTIWESELSMQTAGWINCLVLNAEVVTELGQFLEGSK